LRESGKRDEGESVLRSALYVIKKRALQEGVSHKTRKQRYWRMRPSAQAARVVRLADLAVSIRLGKTEEQGRRLEGEEQKKRSQEVLEQRSVIVEWLPFW